MAINFSNINLKVIDINTNATPDIFVNRNGVTFTKRALDDMNYPQNVQYCIDAENRIFAVRVCRSNDTRATAFSKTKAEHTNTLSCSNKNMHEILQKLITEYNPQMRYRVIGEWDAENKVMYFDMSAAIPSKYR